MEKQLQKEEGIRKEVENYDNLSIKDSARGQVVLAIGGLLVLSFVFSLVFKALGSSVFSPTDVLLSLVLYIPILFFIYKGHRWAMFTMMILWTFDRGYSIVLMAENGLLKLPTLFFGFLFWFWGIVALYRAIKIENARKKLQQTAVPTMTSVWNQERVPMTQNMTAERLHKGVSLTVSLIILVFGIIFYWYGIRPSNIKKECSQFIIKAYTQQERDDARKSYNNTNCSPSTKDMNIKFSCLNWESIFNSSYTQDRKRPANEREYQQCLRENGV